MRKVLLIAVLLSVAVAPSAFAQSQNSRARVEGEAGASARQDGRRLDLASGTRLTAQLENALDVRRARVGDRVVLKTTEAVKANGETVVKKGARLFGTVTDVRQRAGGSAESSVTLLFDRLESGSLTAPVSVTINSVSQTAARARTGDDTFGASAESRGSASARTQGGTSGGLLGGVTDAVGSTVGSTTRTVGGVAGGATDTVGGATETVGSATREVGRTASGIRVTQSVGASLEGGSTLSLVGDNLRLEKGTKFNLTLSGSAGVNDR